MDIVFYGAPMSSAVPVAIALAELAVPHSKVMVDLATKEQRRPEFLRLNPNGKVPTLVVDGTPMFEGVAIIQWLGDRFGTKRGLWPSADDPARLTALSWSSWVYVTYSDAVRRLQMSIHPDTPEGLRAPAMAEHARAQLHELLSMLDEQLEGRNYLLGSQFTLLDIAVCSSVMWSRLIGAPVNDHPMVAAWLERCAARPSVKAQWQSPQS